MPWKMFLIERAPFMRRSLRRFFQTSRPDAPKLPENHYHDTTVVIDPQLDCPGEENGRHTDKGEYAADPRWPKTCLAHLPDPSTPGKTKECGYVFHEDDHWQVNEERLWRGCPDGNLYLLRDHPPGATWISDWFPPEGPNGKWTGPDGNVWAVMMPAGIEWIIYSHASQSNQKWTVTGTPPLIDVSPSIHQIGNYHGFIKGGVISDDCDGRKFPLYPSTA